MWCSELMILASNAGCRYELAATICVSVIRLVSVANALSSVKTPMISDPVTRNRFRPKRSEYGPVRTATTMPGAPYAATTSPAVPVVMLNSTAIWVSTGAMTIPT